MTDIMKLADDYAEALGDARADLGANAGMDEQDPMWVAMKKARAALRVTTEALLGDLKQVKGFWKEAQLRNRNLLEEGNDLAMLADQYKAERDKLQSKLDDLQRQDPVIDFTVLHQFASDQAISYNKLCTAVRMCLAAPKALEPLTGDRIGELQVKHLYLSDDGYSIRGQWEFARAIEAAHGIGGTP